MSFYSDDTDCNKTVALTNTSKCNRFKFDVELDISYTADSTWDDHNHLFKTLSATIAYQIGHKYKQWKVCSCVIAYSLFEEFLLLNPSLNAWKGKISVAGQYYDENSVNDYSEMIYDWFTYDGLMRLSGELKTVHKNSSEIFLQYTIRFHLSPALSSAQHLYYIKGYKKIPKFSPEVWTEYEKEIKLMIDPEGEYNHLLMWQAAYFFYLFSNLNHQSRNMIDSKN